MLLRRSIADTCSCCCPCYHAPQEETKEMVVLDFPEFIEALCGVSILLTRPVLYAACGAPHVVAAPQRAAPTE